jgi:hypothetical protein
MVAINTVPMINRILQMRKSRLVGLSSSSLVDSNRACSQTQVIIILLAELGFDLFLFFFWGGTEV